MELGVSLDLLQLGLGLGLHLLQFCLGVGFYLLQLRLSRFGGGNRRFFRGGQGLKIRPHIGQLGVPLVVQVVVVIDGHYGQHDEGYTQ